MSTSQGHPYAVFQRALKRRNVLSALAAAKDLPQLSLVDALELTVLVARKDPSRHRATIEEAVLAASSLIALTGVAHEEAAQALRAMAERAMAKRGETPRVGLEPTTLRLTAGCSAN